MSGIKLIDKLSSRGGKITPQRKIICEILDRANNHLDIEDIHRQARHKDEHISLSAVYRTMKALDKLELVVSSDFGDSRERYSIKHDEEDTGFLIDTKTGKVTSFQDPEIQKLIARIGERLGYQLEDHRLELYGHRL